MKSVITYYHRVKEIVQSQTKLITAYQKAWGLLKNDRHFSAVEIQYMSRIYTGILQESIENINHLVAIIKPFATQMDDAARLMLINATADKINTNYNDLMRFNTQNAMLSLQRSHDAQETRLVKWMYGL